MNKGYPSQENSYSFVNNDGRGSSANALVSLVENQSRGQSRASFDHDSFSINLGRESVLAKSQSKHIKVVDSIESVIQNQTIENENFRLRRSKCRSKSSSENGRSLNSSKTKQKKANNTQFGDSKSSNRKKTENLELLAYFKKSADEEELAGGLNSPNFADKDEPVERSQTPTPIFKCRPDSQINSGFQKHIVVVDVELHHLKKLKEQAREQPEDKPEINSGTRKPRQMRSVSFNEIQEVGESKDCERLDADSLAQPPERNDKKNIQNTPQKLNKVVAAMEAISISSNKEDDQANASDDSKSNSQSQSLGQSQSINYSDGLFEDEKVGSEEEKKDLIEKVEFAGKQDSNNGIGKKQRPISPNENEVPAESFTQKSQDGAEAMAKQSASLNQIRQKQSGRLENASRDLEFEPIGSVQPRPIMSFKELENIEVQRNKSSKIPSSKKMEIRNVPHSGSQRQGEDPFAVFEENSEEFEEAPEIAKSEIQRSQFSLLVNKPRYSEANDNSFVLTHKASIAPRIKIVERVVYREPEIINTVSESYFQNQLRSQGLPPNSNLNGNQISEIPKSQNPLQSFFGADMDSDARKKIVEEQKIVGAVGELDDDERGFLKELLKNKMNLKMLMGNFEEFKQQASVKASQGVALKPNSSIAKSNEDDYRRIYSPKFRRTILDTEKIQNAKSITYQYESRGSREQPILIRSNQTQPLKEEPQVCKQCFKLSKFMLKQMEKFLNLNQNLDSYIKNSIFSSLMITNLINELLDQAKLEKSTFELDNEYFNLFEVIIHAFQILKFQAETKNIKLMLQIDQSKPFLFCKIWGDKRRYLQILLNFISNSLKFTKKGGFIKVHLKVLQEQHIFSSFSNETEKQLIVERKDPSNASKISVRKKAKSCGPTNSKINLANETKEQLKYIQFQIVIEDNGAGIKKENLNKLFVDYGKLQEHQKMNQKGTGLGLSICKNIVIKMGGEVNVESEEGVGSMFKITQQAKAIDLMVIVNDVLRMSEKAKVGYLKNIGAFDFTSDFDKKFKLVKLLPAPALNSETVDRAASRLLNPSIAAPIKPIRIHSSSSSTNYQSQLQIQPQLMVFQFKQSELDVDHASLGQKAGNKMIGTIRDQLIWKQRQIQRDQQKQEQQSMLGNQSMQYQSIGEVDSDISQSNQKLGELAWTLKKDHADKKQERCHQSQRVNDSRSKRQQSVDRPPQAKQNEAHLRDQSNKGSFYETFVKSQIDVGDHGQRISSAQVPIKNEPIINKVSGSNMFKSNQKVKTDEIIEQTLKNVSFKRPTKTNTDNLANFRERHDLNIVNQLQDFEMLANESAASFDIISSQDQQSQLKSLTKLQINDSGDVPLNINKLKERKLNILLANDDQFSLLIIAQAIKSLSFVDVIDQASNGLEALELVKESEHKQLKQPYDIILLDLEMPILNGYQACKQIIQFYELFDRTQQQSELSRIPRHQLQQSMQSSGSNKLKKNYMQDLQKMLEEYDKQFIKNNEQAEQSQIFCKSIRRLRLQRIIQILYRKVKYWSLDSLRRPYIFAYSALINNQIQERTTEAGFDGCLSAPISVQDLQDLKENYIDKYVNQFMQEQLQQLGLAGIYNQIMANIEAIEAQEQQQVVENSNGQKENVNMEEEKENGAMKCVEDKQPLQSRDNQARARQQPDGALVGERRAWPLVGDGQQSFCPDVAIKPGTQLNLRSSDDDDESGGASPRFHDSINPPSNSCSTPKLGADALAQHEVDREDLDQSFSEQVLGSGLYQQQILKASVVLRRVERDPPPRSLADAGNVGILFEDSVDER